tara:strand:- start:275 stop:442 length:168 start_codon:yes stop_codon:yes gene_type:complete
MSYLKELQGRRKYLIKKLREEMAVTEHEWYENLISDKEYVVRFEDLKKRIKMLER